jgi:hypothetical protein
MVVRVNEYGFVSSTKKLAVMVVTTVETLGVYSVYMPHTAGQITDRSMDQQMIMIGHQAIGSYLDIPSFIRLLKQTDEGLVIIGVQKNLFPSPATIHDMIPGTWIFYA